MRFGRLAARSLPNPPPFRVAFIPNPPLSRRVASPLCVPRFSLRCVARSSTSSSSRTALTTAAAAVAVASAAVSAAAATASTSTAAPVSTRSAATSAAGSAAVGSAAGSAARRRFGATRCRPPPPSLPRHPSSDFARSSSGAVFDFGRPWCCMAVPGDFVAAAVSAAVHVRSDCGVGPGCGAARRLHAAACARTDRRGGVGREWVVLYCRLKKICVLSKLLWWMCARSRVREMQYRTAGLNVLETVWESFPDTPTVFFLQAQLSDGLGTRKNEPRFCASGAFASWQPLVKQSAALTGVNPPCAVGGGVACVLFGVCER